MTQDSIKGWVRGFFTAPPQYCPRMLFPCPNSLTLLSKANPGIQESWSGGPQGDQPQPNPSHMLSLGEPLGGKKSGLACVLVLSQCGGAGCPCAKDSRAQEPGVPSVSMSGWGVVLAASILCVTLPSRGPVPSVPREPQPKLQGDGGEGG